MLTAATPVLAISSAGQSDWMGGRALDVSGGKHAWRARYSRLAIWEASAAGHAGDAAEARPRAQRAAAEAARARAAETMAFAFLLGWLWEVERFQAGDAGFA